MIPRPHLLCIDDEESILKSLERSLRKEPYELLTTTNPTTALELIQKYSIQVIISDYRMEKITGIDFFKKVKETTPHTIRIILSGYADEKLINDALSQGDVHAYLLKPFDSQKLKTEIQNYFLQHQQKVPDAG